MNDRQVSVDQLLAMIGRLTVENTLLQQELAAALVFKNQVVEPTENGVAPRILEPIERDRINNGT